MFGLETLLQMRGTPMRMRGPLAFVQGLGQVLALAALFSVTAQAEAIPPADYTFKPAGPCLEDAERAAKPSRPSDAAYRVCDDQMALLAKGLADARASGKLLLVTFGATWCPWCATLQKMLPTADLLGRTGDKLNYAASFHHIEIGLSTVYKGKKADIPSGEAVLAWTLKRANGAKIRAIPFLAVLDPANPEKIWARNLEDVNQAAGKVEAPKLRALLVDAHAYHKAGGPAPSEPGWLRLKIRHWFNI